jgi:hypothetical protein
MNPASAELLRLLKGKLEKPVRGFAKSPRATLQLSSSPTTETTKVRWFTPLFTPPRVALRKEKAAMPESGSGNAACSFR